MKYGFSIKAIALLLLITCIVLYCNPNPDFNQAPQTILLIGWDGCGRHQLDRNISQGKTPNLVKLSAAHKLMRRSYEVHITTSEKADIASQSWGIIKEASSEMDKALNEGRTKGVDEGRQLLAQATVAFDRGDYYQASNLAKQARKTMLQ